MYCSVFFFARIHSVALYVSCMCVYVCEHVCGRRVVGCAVLAFRASAPNARLSRTTQRQASRSRRVRAERLCCLTLSVFCCFLFFSSLRVTSDVSCMNFGCCLFVCVCVFVFVFVFLRCRLNKHVRCHPRDKRRRSGFPCFHSAWLSLWLFVSLSACCARMCGFCLSFLSFVFSLSLSLSLSRSLARVCLLRARMWIVSFLSFFRVLRSSLARSLTEALPLALQPEWM
jgi:hypothetical protein